MTRRQKTIAAVVVGVILLVLIVPVLWLGATDAGLRWMTSKAVLKSAGALALNGVSGTLLSGAHAARLQFQKRPDASGEQQMAVIGENVDLRWSPIALLWGTLKFSHVHARSLTIALAPPTGRPPPLPKSLKPPMRVVLADMQVDTLWITRQQMQIPIRAARGEFVLGRTRWHGRIASAQTPVGNADLDFKLGTTRPFSLSGSAALSRTTAPAFDSKINLGGSLEHVLAAMAAKAQNARLDGRIGLAPFTNDALESLDLTAQGINPAAWRANAPEADLRIDAHAKTAAGGALAGTYEIVNGMPGKLDAQRLPLVSSRGALAGPMHDMAFNDVTVDMGPGGQFVGNGGWRGSAVMIALKTNNFNLNGLQGTLKPTKMAGTVGVTQAHGGQRLQVNLKDARYGFDVDAEHAQQALTVTRAVVRAGTGSFTGQGKLALAGNRAFTVKGAVRGLDPSEFGAKLPQGSLSGHLDANGQLKPTLSTRAQFKLANSRLFGEAVNGAGKVETTRGKNGMDLAIDANAAIGRTKATAKGTLVDPAHLKRLDLNFVLEGEDLAKLYPITHVPLPATPAYKLVGHLAHENQVWRFSKFKGRVGDSDLSGDFSVDHSGKQKFMRGDLVSRNLDLKDMAGFVGAAPQNSSLEQERKRQQAATSPRVLPQGKFNLEKLHAADADIKFRGEHIVTKKLPLEDMTAHLKLSKGVLTLDPLNFGVAGGNVVSTIVMDSNVKNVQTRADLQAKQLALAKLFPTVKLTKDSAGKIGGRAKVIGTGSSLAQILGSMDGDVAFVMGGGSLSELLLRLANLDIQHTAMVLLTGDRQIPVRCMVSDFKAKSGVLNTEAMVLDTGKENITGTGTIDLHEELVDMRLIAHPKDTSLVALRGPIVIQGPFKKPSVRPDMTNVAVRTGLAAALATIAGPLGLLPLIDVARGDHTDCEALMAEAQKVAAPKQKPMSGR